MTIQLFHISDMTAMSVTAVLSDEWNGTTVDSMAFSGLEVVAAA